jgi:hypothetical protein
MALQQEIWSKDIQELLYPDNAILAKTTDASQFLHYHTVHLPQAGANGLVTKNLALNGALAGTYQRTDTVIQYTIDSYAVQPVIVSDLETYQVSYDKRKSILYNAAKNLQTVQTDTFLYEIAPLTANTFTTGAFSGNSLAFQTSGVGGATGTRRQTTFSDVTNLKSILDKQNVPQTERVLIAPSDIYNNELLQLPNVLNMYQFASAGINQAVAPTGSVAKVMGFDIYERPTTVIYTSGNTGSVATLVSQVQGLSGDSQPTTVNPSDCWGILAWHPDFVTFAKGEVEVFYTENYAPAYGSILSFLVWAGGSLLRQDGKGIAALVQGIV